MKKMKKSIILIILCIIGVSSGIWRASEKIKLSELPVVYPPKPIEVVKLYQPTDLSFLNEDKSDNEVEIVDSCQNHHQRNQHRRLDEAGSHLLHYQEGHYDGHQHENVISDILHYLNSFLNDVGTGVSNSIDAPVTG